MQTFAEVQAATSAAYRTLGDLEWEVESTTVTHSSADWSGGIFNLQLFRPEKASAVLGVCVTCIVGACGSVRACILLPLA